MMETQRDVPLEEEAPPTLEEAQAEYDAFMVAIGEQTKELSGFDAELVELNRKSKVIEAQYAQVLFERTEKIDLMHKLLNVMLEMKFGKVANEGYYGLLNRRDRQTRSVPDPAP